MIKVNMLCRYSLSVEYVSVVCYLQSHPQLREYWSPMALSMEIGWRSSYLIF